LPKKIIRFVFSLDAEITGHSIMTGAGLVIALGVFILLLSLLGKEKVHLSKIQYENL